MQETQENFTHDTNTNSLPEEILLWLCFNELSLRELPKIRKSIQNSISDLLDIEQQYVDSFMLSATEILSNLIQHGEKLSYVGIALYTEYEKDKKYLTLDISDNGQSIKTFEIKYNSSRHKVQNKIVKEDENNNGRGIGIIDSLMDKLDYKEAKNSSDNLNHMIIKKLLNIDTSKTISSFAEANNSEDNIKEHSIFIVDDDQIMRKMIDSILSKHYNTYLFASAKEALDAFEDKQPDLVLSDLLMPVMNGAELREALSSKKNGDITPFIFLSGHPEEAGKDYVSRLGIDGFLNKSINKDELLETIKRTIRRSLQIKNNIPEQITKDINAALSPQAPNNTDHWKFALKHDIAETVLWDLLLQYETQNGMMIVFADVMGHGISAKFFAYAYMGYLRSTIRMMIKDNIDPQKLLNIVSKNIYEDDFLDDCIFTCQVLLLSDDGTLKISSAGHPYPILINKNGNNEYMEISGTLPGMLPNASYSQKEYQMQKGDKLILYTDGLLENISHEDSKKIQNILIKNIRKYSMLENIDEMLDNIWNNQISEFSDNFVDDATIVAIEYVGSNKP